MNKAFDILNLLDEIGKKQFMPSIGSIKGKIISDIIREVQNQKRYWKLVLYMDIQPF